jgi:signal transduction histidine kinase/CheY-like chemotaxis protein
MAMIVVVDDRPANREVLTALLGYGGHRLVEAGDGSEALKVIEAATPDLIISDILMPTMDGFEFVRRLRADARTSDTPVIFCTAHFLNREATALARAVGVSQILHKPLDPEAVLAAVDGALKRGRHAAPPADSPSAGRDRLRAATEALRENVDALNATNGKLNALIDLTISLGSERDPGALMDQLCRVAREVCAARYAAVGLEMPDGQWQFASKGAALTSLPHPEGAIWPALLAAMAQDRKPRRLSAAAPELASLAPDVPLHDPDGTPGALLAVPITSPGAAYGSLLLVGKIGLAAFGDEDEALASHLAALVGRIYENAILYREMETRAAALEAEMAVRRRAEQERAELQQQLFHAQKMEAIGTLAGGMAHDINNCLVPIITLAPLAREMTPPDAPQQKCLQLIEEAGARIRDLVRRILVFSRREEVATAPVDLAVVFAETVELLRATLPATIELRVRTRPGCAIVQGDAQQLQQVLLNLGVNAADAIEDRRGIIELALEEIRVHEPIGAVDGAIGPGLYYALRVADNGAGMAPDTLAHIFEPFFTTKPPGEGTGLGLAMVHSVAQAHSAKLRVTSRVHAGTTFEIYLPPAAAAVDRGEPCHASW